jgi:hypothetical protein
VSKTTIPAKVVLRLWLRAGGRCQFRGCNAPLWRDELTLTDMNNALIAHIIADSPDGPRGDPVLSPKLAKDLSNLMLLCPTHHRLIDDPEKWRDYPVELLREYKRLHEERIERLTSLDECMKTHLMFFTDHIGSRSPSITYAQACLAVLPRYPVEPKAIEIQLAHSPYRDHEPAYFATRQQEVTRLVEARLRQRAVDEGIDHVSIFALASLPLLIHFGYELGEAIPSEIYQGHRDTNSWAWQPLASSDPGYMIDAPAGAHLGDMKVVALNLSLSGVIRPEEIMQALDVPCCAYTMTVLRPNRDYLKSKAQLDGFAGAMRDLLCRIREVHRSDCEIHLFPAIPAAVAVKLGQLLLPKADPPLHIYDHHPRYGGFRYALTVPRRKHE